MAKISKKQELDILISSYDELSKKPDALTQKGLDYLDGLKQARKIVFGEFKNKNNK